MDRISPLSNRDWNSRSILTRYLELHNTILATNEKLNIFEKKCTYIVNQKVKNTSDIISQCVRSNAEFIFLRTDARVSFSFEYLDSLKSKPSGFDSNSMKPIFS